MSRRLGLLFVLVLAACSASPTATDATASGPGVLVAWSASSIQVLHPGTEDEHATIELETGGEIVSQVTPSPDGRVAWTGIDDSVARTRIGSLEGGEPQSVPVPTAPFYYAWDPTGQRLGFLGNDPDGAGVLFGSTEAGSGEARRHLVATPFFFDWSADGSQILANVGATGLGRFDFPNADLTDLGITPGAFPTPLWGAERAVVVTRRSPAVGARLVQVTSHSEAQIVSLDPATGERRVIAAVDEPARLYGDGSNERLAVVTGNPGEQTLSILEIETGDVLADRTADAFALVQWSPDGRSLLYTTGAGMLTPRLWALDAERDRRFAPFRPSEVFRTAYLPFWDQYDRSMSLWALDSSRFALPAQDGVRVLSVGGDVRRIEDVSMAVFAPGSTP